MNTRDLLPFAEHVISNCTLALTLQGTSANCHLGTTSVTKEPSWEGWCFSAWCATVQNHPKSTLLIYKVFTRSLPMQ